MAASVDFLAMLFAPDDFLAITTVAVGVTVMFSKWLAEDKDDDDPLLEVSILECLFIGGGGIGLDMVVTING
jgi:hypothetical protein